MATIVSIVYQPTDSAARPNTQFYRISIEKAYLIADYGIEGDHKSGRNPNRHINIMSYETVCQLRQQGFKTEPGEMGEQMIVDGLDIMDLERGDRLLLGNDAIVEVTFPRTSCKRFEDIQNQLGQTVNFDLGIFVRVIHSGTVKAGDRVGIVEVQPRIIVPAL